MKRPLVVKTSDEKADDNFRRVADQLELAGPLNGAEPVIVDLVTGDNAIRPPGRTRPRGCLITFRSAAATLYDKGLNPAGQWVINASAPLTVHVIFV